MLLRFRKPLHTYAVYSRLKPAAFELGTLHWLLSPGVYECHFGAALGWFSEPNKHCQDCMMLIIQSLQCMKCMKNHADVQQVDDIQLTSMCSPALVLQASASVKYI